MHEVKDLRHPRVTTRCVFNNDNLVDLERLDDCHKSGLILANIADEDSFMQRYYYRT